MNTIPAINILEACEKGLQKQGADALAAGDYDSARHIMMWAENVAAMTAGARRDDNPPEPRATIPPPSAKAPRPSFKNRMIQDEYPRFHRRGDELVKIGWSKSDRKEYHHRAPKRALDALVARLKQIA